jgi:hypothetical protein
MSKHTWVIGTYKPTKNFASIPEHACVCEEDTGALIALTGPVNDLKSQDQAALFAAAPELLEALYASTAVLTNLLAADPFNGVLKSRIARNRLATHKAQGDSWSQFWREATQTKETHHD